MKFVNANWRMKTVPGLQVYNDHINKYETIEDMELSELIPLAESIFRVGAADVLISLQANDNGFDAVFYRAYLRMYLKSLDSGVDTDDFHYCTSIGRCQVTLEDFESSVFYQHSSLDIETLWSIMRKQRVFFVATI